MPQTKEFNSASSKNRTVFLDKPLATYGSSQLIHSPIAEDWQTEEDPDSIRVYIPMDLSRKSILRRL